MGKTLKSKTIKGIKWTSIYTVFNSLSYPLYQVILALLLLPQDFAYIAVISLFINLSLIINNLGIGEAVIQKDNVNSNQISTLFYFNLIISFLIAGSIYICAPLIENYYNLINLEEIIKIITITIVLNGSTSIFRVCLQKHLFFKEYALIKIFRAFIDMIITIILVIKGFGIWGFVYGTLFSTLIYALLVLFYALKKTKYKIKFHFNLKDTIPFLSFGISISLKKILTEASHRFDEIIIGGFLSSEVLGIYYFGKNLIIHLRILITNAFGQVLLPVFSKIKNDIEKAKLAYNKISYFVAMVAFPTFIGVSITAHLFIPVAFGEQWIGSVQVVRVLAITMIFLVLTANIATSMLYSLNKPVLVLIIDMVSTIIYIISLVIFGKYGIGFILLIYSMYIIFKTTLLQYFVSKNLKYRIKYYFLQFKKIVFSTVFMLSIVILCQKTILNESNELFQLIFSITIGATIYISTQIVIDNKNSKELLQMVTKKSF